MCACVAAYNDHCALTLIHDYFGGFVMDTSKFQLHYAYLLIILLKQQQ